MKEREREPIRGPLPLFFEKNQKKEEKGEKKRKKQLRFLYANY